MHFDRIILGVDESNFLQYLPLVSKAWQNFFPRKKLTVAFVTDRSKDDDVVKKMEEYGDVELFNTIPGIPTANHAKVARHILATKYGDEVCLIEDMDTAPLQSNYLNCIIKNREQGKLLAVGPEVFGNTGQFPISNMSAESYIFKELINPLNLNAEDLVKSWMGIKVYDECEAVDGPPIKFSDEKLLRILIERWQNKKITYINRGMNIRKEWIDRSWWSIKTKKLFKGEYIYVNFLRPFDANYRHIKPIVKYICGRDMKKEDIIFPFCLENETSTSFIHKIFKNFKFLSTRS